MRFVIQRVTEASVTIDGEISGKIGKGYLVLIGVADTDTKEIADKMIRKMIGLRIFEDEQGKTNLSLADEDGVFFWFHSLRYMQTVREETDQALLKQENRIWRMRCMNISLKNAGNQWMKYRPESLELI
jgi:hypothetical protein